VVPAGAEAGVGPARVGASTVTRALVAFGDSITDGCGSTVDAGHR
jgi:hypothetical protein